MQRGEPVITAFGHEPVGGRVQRLQPGQITERGRLEVVQVGISGKARSLVAPSLVERLHDPARHASSMPSHLRRW